MKQVVDKKLTLKVNYFWWVASHGKILTIDNLVRRGFQLVNRCVLSKEEEETIVHLFFHCPFSRGTWSFFLPLLCTDWVFPHSIKFFIDNGPLTLTLTRSLWIFGFKFLLLQNEGYGRRETT